MTTLGKRLMVSVAGGIGAILAVALAQPGIAQPDAGKRLHGADGAVAGGQGGASKAQAAAAQPRKAQARTSRAKANRTKTIKAKTIKAKTARAKTAEARTAAAGASRTKTARAKTLHAKATRLKVGHVKSARPRIVRAGNPAARADGIRGEKKAPARAGAAAGVRNRRLHVASAAIALAAKPRPAPVERSGPAGARRQSVVPEMPLALSSAIALLQPGAQATASGGAPVDRSAADPIQPRAPARGAVDDPGSATEDADGGGRPGPFAGGRRGIGPMAQFQLPATAGPRGGPPRPVTQFLTYQYSLGSESDLTYRRNRDLDARLRDDSLLLAPQLNGYILYRPNDRVETLLEMLLEREVPAREENMVVLPGGELQPAPKRYTSLAVDQAWVKFKGVGPFDLTVGRRNFEDERHWLYDTSLDALHARARWEDFHFEASVARKDRLDGDLLAPVDKGHINRAMLYADYRGIDDIKFAAYSIRSDDKAGQEGRPWHLGLRAYGAPSDRFSFWSELALLRGHDELQQRFAAHAADLGMLYRFPDLPLHPSVMLGYAYGSGDDQPGDNTNRAFRQTGLQSNEVKGGGVSKFKYYGETLDPELSNLRIVTAGLGFRPGQSVYVDLVYHSYRLNALADELRNADLSAQMNQDDTRLSKDVGSAFDVVVGLRNLFGIRRLGLDLRVGMFRPGRAFRNEVGAMPGGPLFAGADKSVSALVKFWW